MRERVQFFDLLRCVAAVAVIAIHVLAPYRHELGVIPFDQWVTAVGINGISRWAVPVFILITGALMLSDTRPFDLPYYARRRLGKVLIPFLFWSLFYALLSGLSASGFDSSKVTEVLSNSPEHATYYHLGFFYYFIPLYFVIPMFQWLVRQQRQDILYLFTALWLFTTVLYLAGIDGPWSYELWLYSGYLPLGYLLFSKVPNQRSVVERLSAQWQKWVALISRHSLGIYLLHPIFLWPMKELGWYLGHPAWVIPLWVVLSGAGALALSYLFSLSAKTRWLLP
ncbi:hypothetical protein XM75_c10084 [Vibrio vulnificus]|uniref:acyltransferase n=1 Tax=Vibrio vulnificus TaxID=672 RepID=UPI0009B6EB0F|nr:acyltransferase family protein [Vibrio vulnificus]OQK55378.1 hypothetical protein XM75_c10084 [Vibrio vulnificus]